MKWIIIVLAVITGGFMLIDGIHVMLKGKYIGPPKPGPWAAVFQALKLDVFKLGPLFIGFGLAWLVFVAGLWMQRSWCFPLGIAVAVLTLWYLPVGTLFSVAVLIMLVASRTKLGI